MNYARVYAEFIRDRLAKQPSKPTYFETHHITPRCLGGGNEPDNLIRLTPEDHIHAHILLAKIHGGRLWGSALFMTKSAVGRAKSVRRVPTVGEVRAAGFARRMHAGWVVGENHPMFGRKHTEHSREKMKAAQQARAGMGRHWAQLNPGVISGPNHWMRLDRHSASLAETKARCHENLAHPLMRRSGDENPMRRQEVAKKVGAAVAQHHANGTGVASVEAKKRHRDAHRTDEYLLGARQRVLGERNPMFGKSAEKNPNSRAVLCVETGEIFGSVKAAIEFCGGDVTKAARTGGMAGGFHWERIGSHTADGRVMRPS